MRAPFFALLGAFAATQATLANASTFTVTNINDTGAGSLRQAILDANANPGADTITFNVALAPTTITQGATAMTSTGPLFIDGTSQPGYSGTPRINIRNAAIVMGPDASEIRGIGMRNDGTNVRSLGNCTIRDCWFGFDSLGGNGAPLIGVQLDGGMNNQVINCSFGGVGSTTMTGLSMVNSSFNTVKGCKFGTDQNGTALKAVRNPIVISGGTDNVLGGTATGDGNLIAGDFITAISVTNSPNFGYYGNTMGTDITGTVALGTGALQAPGYGISLVNCPDSQIGMPGTTDGGNMFAGRCIIAVNISDSDRSKVVNNQFGLNRAGTTYLPSSTGFIGADVQTVSSDAVEVGDGTTTGMNVMAYSYNGVILRDSTNCIVDGNHIGVDRTGTVWFPHQGTSGASGIWLAGTTGGGHRIGRELGGTTLGNVIVTRFFLAGVLINSSSNNGIYGNLFGLAADGTTLLGEMAAGVWNVGGNGNRIEQNLYGTCTIGIDNGSSGIKRTQNDTNDVDTGPNGLLNHPVIQGAIAIPGQIRIRGKKDPTQTGYSRISFYSTPDTTTFTEGPAGRHYLGSLEYPSGSGTGLVQFDVTFAESVPVGHVITATGTDTTDSTSEFSDARSVTVNTLPTANAGTDQTKTIVHDGNPATDTASFTLNGTLSSDATPSDVLSYEWRDENNVVVGTTALSTTVATAGTHVYTLTVTDLFGETSQDTVQIVVNPEPNATPFAQITPVFPVVPHDGDPDTNTVTFTINGSGTDPNGVQDVLTYEWRDAWNNVIGNGPSVTVTETLGNRLYRLYVTDPYGATGSNSVQIVIQAEPNQMPVARVEPVNPATIEHDGNAATNTATITADGTNSFDPDGTQDTLSFEWRNGSNLVVGTDPTLTVDEVAGTHTYTLAVVDPYGYRREVSFQFVVNPEPNQAPEASPGAAQSLAISHDGDPGTDTAPVILNGAGSSDPDGIQDVLTYEWTDENSVVVGTTAIVSTSAGAGSHTFTLTVKDPYGATSARSTQVDVAEEPNQAPTGSAGDNQSVEAGPSNDAPVTIVSSVLDPDGDTLTYEWKDSGGAVVGNGPVLALTLPVGDHTFSLTVTDPYNAAFTGSVNVHVESPNDPPYVTAGPDQIINANSSGYGSALLTALYGDPDGDALTIQWSEGGNPLGNTIPLSVSLPAGVHVLTVTVTDPGGLSASDSMVVRVFYAWSGFLQPINMDNSSIFKLGSTVPVKFELVGISQGAQPVARIYIAKVSNGIVGTEFEPETNVQADAGNLFRILSNQYIFNWSTKGLTAGTYQIRADLGDGNMSRVVLVSLK